MIWCSVSYLLLLLLIAWFRDRDVKSPAILHEIMWIIALLVLSFSPYSGSAASNGLLFVCFGATLFQIGFRFFYKTVRTGIEQQSGLFVINVNNIRRLIIIVSILLFPAIYQYVSYLKVYRGTLYSALSSASQELNLPFMFAYYCKFVQYLSIGLLAIYWSEEVTTRKKFKTYIVIFVVLAILTVISVPTRNNILFYLLPMIMVYFVTHNTSNKRMVLILLLGAVFFLAIFYFVSRGKFSFRYRGNIDKIEVFKSELCAYLYGGVLAFSKYGFLHSFSRLGANSFRFFLAINDALFSTNYAPALVNDFCFIDGFTTNVYTFYDFYIRDFGMAYALLAQFVVSAIHGRNYKKAKAKNLKQMYYFSLLSYPLIMQFFQDQYLSLLSLWIQIILVGIILFDSKLFVIY